MSLLWFAECCFSNRPNVSWVLLLRGEATGKIGGTNPALVLRDMHTVILEQLKGFL